MTLQRPASVTDDFLRKLVARVPSSDGGTWKLTEVYTGELLVGPSYERIKVKPFEALVGRKCPPEDLPEGTLARDTSLKAFQLDERAERRMPPNLAV